MNDLETVEQKSAETVKLPKGRQLEIYSGPGGVPENATCYNTTESILMIHDGSKWVPFEQPTPKT